MFSGPTSRAVGRLKKKTKLRFSRFPDLTLTGSVNDAGIATL